MKMRPSSNKIISLAQMVRERRKLKKAGRRLVFTNGCFDLLHVGHADYLARARNQGDALVVAVNSDASVRRSKGPSRPIIPQAERTRMLAALEAVDFVLVFNESEPTRVIGAILPDVLVKGADWSHYVAGRDVVEANGGRVFLAPLIRGKSTSQIIQRILKKRSCPLRSKAKTASS